MPKSISVKKGYYGCQLDLKVWKTVKAGKWKNMLTVNRKKENGESKKKVQRYKEKKTFDKRIKNLCDTFVVEEI